MRISYLASAALAVCFLPLATPAYAGCSGDGCVTGETSITYGSGTYGFSGQSSHSSSMHGSLNSGSHSPHSMRTRYGSGSTSFCPLGSTRSSDGFCITSGSSSSVGVSSSSSFASGGFTSPPSMRSVGTRTIVPFRTSVNNISNYRIDGMGSNEFLSKTSCPTSVYNPGGHKVLGCYSVVKPAPVYRPAPVIVPQIHYQKIRVVRPIIYVRYPVPTPVPVYWQTFSQFSQSSQFYSSQFYSGQFYSGQFNSGKFNSGGCGTAYSRYGNNWPRMGGGCGGW